MYGTRYDDGSFRSDGQVWTFSEQIYSNRYGYLPIPVQDPWGRSEAHHHSPSKTSHHDIASLSLWLTVGVILAPRYGCSKPLSQQCTRLVDQLTSHNIASLTSFTVFSRMLKKLLTMSRGTHTPLVLSQAVTRDGETRLYPIGGREASGGCTDW